MMQLYGVARCAIIDDINNSYRNQRIIELIDGLTPMRIVQIINQYLEGEQFDNILDMFEGCQKTWFYFHALFLNDMSAGERKKNLSNHRVQKIKRTNNKTKKWNFSDEDEPNIPRHDCARLNIILTPQTISSAASMCAEAGIV